MLRMVTEESHERGLEAWAASLGLQNAFDKFSHEAVLYSLRDAFVGPDIIIILWELYNKQTAYVQAGARGFQSRGRNDTQCSEV